MPTRYPVPTPLTPDERTRRIAALLATGLLRLGCTLPPSTFPPIHGPQMSPDPTPNELATVPDTSVTGHAG